MEDLLSIPDVSTIFPLYKLTCANIAQTEGLRPMALQEKSTII
jgi:hypothetical protein